MVVALWLSEWLSAVNSFSSVKEEPGLRQIIKGRTLWNQIHDSVCCYYTDVGQCFTPWAEDFSNNIYVRKFFHIHSESCVLSPRDFVCVCLYRSVTHIPLHCVHIDVCIHTTFVSMCLVCVYLLHV